MNSSPLVRLSAIAAPVLLFLYGTLRLIDGADGHHDKSGLLWRAGHVMFFIAFALLGALAVGVRPLLAGANRVLVNVAVGASVFGAACFLWVTVGDLSARFRDAAALPDLLQIVGPALFELGMMTLLVLLVRARHLPAWSPVAVLFAFIAISADLDLIPPAAVLLLAGLLPLTGILFNRGSHAPVR